MMRKTTAAISGWWWRVSGVGGEANKREGSERGSSKRGPQPGDVRMGSHSSGLGNVPSL